MPEDKKIDICFKIPFGQGHFVNVRIMRGIGSICNLRGFHVVGLHSLLMYSRKLASDSYRFTEYGWASLDRGSFARLKCEKYASSRCTLKWPLADVNFASLHEYMTCLILFNYERVQARHKRWDSEEALVERRDFSNWNITNTQPHSFATTPLSHFCTWLDSRMRDTH